MKKLSSYQKMKKRVEKLEKEKRTLVLEPNSIEAQLIKSRAKMIYDGIDSILFGSRNNKGNGILSAMGCQSN
jgi:hypothetical protein